MSAFASVAFCGTTTSPFLLERRHIRVLCSYWRCQKWRACLLYTFFISATSLMYLPQDMNGVAEHDTRTTLQDLFQLIAVQDQSTHPWRSNIKSHTCSAPLYNCQVLNACVFPISGPLSVVDERHPKSNICVWLEPLTTRAQVHSTALAHRLCDSCVSSKADKHGEDAFLCVTSDFQKPASSSINGVMTHVTGAANLGYLRPLLTRLSG
jgi:hypothetical protein